ncbi:protein of unknown function [Collimonas sp. OK607]|uniref:DUF4936 family protein n=1 Tax=Collimonas sp. OK607 TaxID=1798194 RepID=UPI0008EC95BF|nr:DUF4936 family protein [Collimonas sp. OK607]SFA69575.1 protein of unknown function [Collimonas sp. OK607]
MSTDLYIYYRVAAANAQQFDTAAAAMQAGLSLQYQIATALKRSPEIKDEHHTWMEVYSSVPPDFTEIIEQAVTQHGLAALIDGPRHTEFFVNISSCA